MIKSTEVEAVLRQMLNKSGFDSENPNPEKLWGVLKEFSKVEVQCEEDAFLFQCGVYDFTGRDLFHWGFVRQFVIEDNGEYDHMEQLLCNLYFEIVPELENIVTEVWSYGYESVDEFFNNVENLEEFKVAFKHIPIASEIWLEEV